MSYQTRNIIILSLFLLVILTTGAWYTIWSYPQKIEKAGKESAVLEKQARQLEALELEYPVVKQQAQEKRERLAGIDKAITNTVASSATYAYLNQIMSYTGTLGFEISHTGGKSFADYGYQIYKLKGEGPFKQVFDFLWYIERGPGMYRLMNVSLKGVEDRDEETDDPQLVIPFETELWAYYAQGDDLPQVRRTLADVRRVSPRNIFYPYLRRNLPPNDENLVEADRSQLKALVAGKALIEDQNGTAHMMSLGDRVYLGYVSAINAARNQVVFTINKGGAVEKVVLDMTFEDAGTPQPNGE